MINVTRLPSGVGVIIGVVMYEVSNTFQYLIQPVFFPAFFRLLGLLMVVFYLSRTSYCRPEGKVSPLFSVFFVWTLLMAIRGSLIGNYAPGTDTSIIGILQRALLSPYGAMAFFIPFFANVRVPLNSLFYLKRIAIFLSVISLFVTFFFREQILLGIVSQGATDLTGGDGGELSVRHLLMALFSGYGVILTFLFCFNYIKGKVAFVFPIAILVFFLSNAIGGGRGQTALNLLYLVVFFYLMIKYPVNTDLRRVGKVAKKTGGFRYFLFAAAFAFLLCFLYINTEVFDYVLQRSFGDKTFDGEFINTSRDILKKDMINDFNNHPLDWIWGRGVNGSYRTQHYATAGRRMWMEWGYLYLILKGGIVYLFLFVCCLLHAAYLGFFRSNNAFSKGLAVMCVVLLLNLVSTGAEPQFTTMFLMPWICFGLLERKQTRMLRDIDIYGYFNVKNYIPQ